MKKFSKFAAAATAFSLAATMASCSAPAIGSGSADAVTIDGQKVPAGVFIYYTISAYYEAANLLYEQNGAVPELDDVKNSQIDNTDASEWIQNKATTYCSMYVAVEREFNKIGDNISISDEDLAEVDEMLEQYAEQPIYTENGVSEESLKKVLMCEKKNTAIFDYYYGFEGEKGCSEDELKEYFDENFARVKYIKLSTNDSEGNALDEDDKHELEQKAEEYAKEINSESGTLNKMFKVDELQDDYNEYVEEKKAEASAESGETTTTAAVTTTTTTTTTSSNETTTTTTTNPYANEKIIMRVTTTVTDPDEIVVTAQTTTSASGTSTSTDTMANLKNFIFGDLGYDKAAVFPDEENNAIYVVIRADLKERLTTDDLWSQDYIDSLRSLRYEEDFSDFIEETANSLPIDKNKTAYRRYSPFKLNLDITSSN
ncbi:MAG: hypothetical protein ACI4JE_03145 [Ruminococcus sp.]|nr:hypothetical protein [Oscillospiraceae bacterium]